MTAFARTATSRTAQPRIVLVLGMHRSGTSMLVGMLGRLGLPLGGPLLDDVRDDAPTGYSEHAEVVAIQEALLASLGRVWAGPDGALPLPSTWRSWPESRAAQASLSGIVWRELTAGRGLWGVKDPRSCRFLPLWQDVARDCGAEMVPILAIRNPAAVAGSLATRNGMEAAHARRLWLAHVQAVAAAFPAQRPVIMDYDKVLDDPSAAATRLAEAMGLAVRPDAIIHAAALTDRMHRHHVIAADEANAADEASRLYAALLAGGWPLPSEPVTPSKAAVTIVMRTTRPTLLPRAVRSVLGQTMPGWELVIANDGGAASTVEAALAPYRDALGTRVRVLHLPERIGMEAASNAAIQAGTAPWILVHDDDDSLRPAFLERCLDTLARQGLEGVVTRSVAVRERHVAGRLHIEGEEIFLPDVNAITADLLAEQNLFPPISFVFSRRGWEAAGPFREDLEALGDWDFNRRFAARFPIGFLDEPLARYHLRPPDDVLPNTDLAEHEAVRVRLRLEGSAVSATQPSGRMPDFLVIGAQRAGTTWLHRNLVCHPSVWLPPAKELHFFDSLYGPDAARWAEDRRRFFLQSKDALQRAGSDPRALANARGTLHWAGRFAAAAPPTPRWYASLFAAAPEGTIAGDITPGYAVLRSEAVAYAAKLLPEAKILMLLRDPLERSLSGALHEVCLTLPDGVAPSAAAIQEALEAPRCIARSAYRATIERWERYFGSGRLAFLFFDDVQADPLAALGEACRILGIPFSREHFPHAAQRENASNHDALALAGNEALQRLAARHLEDLDWLARRLGGAAARWAGRAHDLLSSPGTAQRAPSRNARSRPVKAVEALQQVEADPLSVSPSERGLHNRLDMPTDARPQASINSQNLDDASFAEMTPDTRPFAPAELRDLPYRRRRGLVRSPILYPLTLIPRPVELLRRAVALRSADWKSLTQRAFQWASAPWSLEARLRSVEAGEVWNRSSRGVVLYAHYARNGAVSAMVLCQLEAYSRLGFNIIVASSGAPPGSAGWQALRSKATFVISRRNVGYDFGSWSDAVPLLLKNFAGASEVLLVNDSIVGPLQPLEPLFAALRAQGEGLFGLTDSYQIRPHLQSYFLLARGTAAVADLATFLQAMPIALTKRRVIRRGEIALSEWMRRRGHKVVAMFGYERVESALVADPTDRAAILAGLRWWRRLWNIGHLGELELHRRLMRTPLNPTHHMASVLVRRFGFPFIKTELLLRNPGRLPEALRWRDWLSAECPCDVAMIEGHLSDVTRSPQRSISGRSTTSRPTMANRSLILPCDSRPAPDVPPSFPSLTEPPEVSVIIPTFGGVEMTLRCLASLSEQRPSASLEVIVAEDASGNPAVTQLVSVPGVRVLLQKENVGFLRNCNAAATQTRGEYLLFLNDDTQVLAGAVDALLELARRRPDAGLIGAKLVYPDGRLQEAGGIIWRDASGLNFGRDDADPNRSEYEYVREVDYCSGAALLVRRALFEELGGFDPVFSPAYYEDTDLAFRVRKRGLKVLYQPRAVVVHHEGASHGTDTSCGIKALQPRNRRIMLERWYDELVSGHAAPGVHLLRARDRAFGRPLVLVADHKVPEPDRDAGSRSCLDVLRTLLELGAIVKFLPANGVLSGSYGTALQAMGIEVLQGSQAAMLEWIAKHGAELDAVLLQRPSVAEWLLPALRAAQVRRIAYYGHDLHHTREYQQGKLLRDAQMLTRAAATEQLERHLCRKVDMALFPSVDEVATMRDLEPGAALEVLPLYRVEATIKRGAPPPSADLLLVGSFAHPPNEDAARWFAAEILPQILARQPKSRLLVAGSSSERLAGTFANPAVLVLGTLEEVALHRLYAEARVSVVPLRFGAGVKGKVVEAMVQGIPLVTTPVGAQGLPGLDRILPVHADTTRFAQAVLRLMADDNVWQRQSARQTAYVQTEFAPSRMRDALIKALKITDPTVKYVSA